MSVIRRPVFCLLVATALSNTAIAQSQSVPVVDLNKPATSSQTTTVAAQSAAPSQAQPPSETAQMLMLLEQLQEEVRYLRGQVEEQAHEMKKMRTDQRDRYRDLDRRIMAINQRMSETPAVPVNTSLPPSPAASDAAPAEPVAAPVTGDSDQNAYKKAFQLVRDRAYDDAIKAFGDFVKFYPQSPLVPNALFWTGEVYRAKNNPDQQAARDAYERLIQQYPTSPKAADAYYKLGLSLDALGEAGKARETMEKAISLYPDQSASRLAKEYLAKHPK